MEIEVLLKESRAIRDGHFKLNSGLHSPTHVDVPSILTRVRESNHFCQALAAKFYTLDIDVVVGVASGGITFGRLVAQRLVYWKEQLRFVQTIKRNNRSITIDDRWNDILAGKSCLIIDDVVTSGRAIVETGAAIRQAGGEIIGVGAIMCRRKIEEIPFPNFHALVYEDFPEYRPKDCPQCQAGIELTQAP